MDFAAARANMVESQIRPNKVTDARVIAAFSAVPRECFVPKALRGVAYVDEDVPIGNGRYLMEPMVLARLLQAAQPQPGDLALEIGSGTGYGSAVLARLAGTVVAVEDDPALSAKAMSELVELGIDNVAIVNGPLMAGYPAQAPYDVILFSGAVGTVPAAIREQLAEGGRLVAVESDGTGLGKARMLTRTGGVVSGRVLFDAAVPLLPGAAREPTFVF